MEQSLEGLSLKTNISHARVNFLWAIATGSNQGKVEELFEEYMYWYDQLGDRTIRDKLKHKKTGLKYFEYMSREENK
jgi:hypothetical protein